MISRSMNLSIDSVEDSPFIALCIWQCNSLIWPPNNVMNKVLNLSTLIIWSVALKELIRIWDFLKHLRLGRLVNIEIDVATANLPSNSLTSTYDSVGSSFLYKSFVWHEYFHHFFITKDFFLPYFFFLCEKY